MAAPRRSSSRPPKRRSTPVRSRPTRPIGPGPVAGRPLPSWPFTGLFLLFPLWWALGLADIVVIPLAGAMALYLARTKTVRIPSGFGIWCLFVVFMLCSVTELDRSKQYLTFIYRALFYLSVTVVLVYVYNARRRLPAKRILGQLTGYWAVVVAGGFLGVLDPNGSLRTPAYYVVSRAVPGLLSNALVTTMVIRPFSQYSPDNYFQVPPRPAAPFLFTNEWGSAYSLLLPLVLLFFAHTRRRGAARRTLLVLIPLSAVPAILTANRGMMIGLGVALVYSGVRLAQRRNYRATAALGLLAAIGAGLWFSHPLQQNLGSRTAVSTSTRLSVYEQALHAVASSPFFGFGVPISSDNQYDPAVGTQGQFWMVLVSHGVIAALCFTGFFVIVTARAARRTDAIGLVGSTVILVATIELLYYGLVPYGLPIVMSVAALALRPAESSACTLGRSGFVHHPQLAGTERPNSAARPASVATGG